jgi:hypothetical protein
MGALLPPVKSILSRSPSNHHLIDLALQEKNMESLSALGGVEALAKTLGSDPLFGIDAASQDSRQQEYGCNKLPDKEGESFFSLLVSLPQLHHAASSDIPHASPFSRSGATSRTPSSSC